MINIESVNKLKDLEDKITAARKNFDEGSFESKYDKEDAKMEVKELEYEYKTETVDLTAEDKQALIELAAENNVELKYLFELEFNETQKQNVKNGFGLLHSPMPFEDELIEMLEEEERRKKQEQEQSKKKKGLFGFKK